MGGLTEKQIQDQMIEWLSLQRDVFVWRQNAGMSIRKTKGKSHVFRAASIDGISDIIGMIGGHFLAVEVKRPGKKPTLNQEEFIGRVKKYGGFALVSTSLGELRMQIEDIREELYERVNRS